MRTELNPLRPALAVAAILAALAASPVAATELASATISSTALSPTSWQYSVTLDDVGTTPLGTLWFAWIPGQDYMTTSPTDVTSPTSWASKITHGGPTDGYAIQWVAGAGAALQAGQSLSGFSFDSTMSPTQMAADSPLFPGTPVLTSFVYGGTPFSDAGVRFVVQTAPVPEPSSLALTGMGALLFFGRRLGRKRT